MTDPTTTKDVRIPTILSKNPILIDFCRQYLSAVDEIAGYNKEVLAVSDSDWTSGKVLAKAREFAAPEDPTKADEEVKGVYTEWERLTTELSKARRAVVDMTAKKLGITLSATGERNPELEAPLKDRRKLANEIGNNLEVMAKLLNDDKVSGPISEFLEKNPLPMVGRDQVTKFGSDEKSTPKYRVTVQAFKNGEEVLNEAGFTKASQALAKPAFNYERGKSPKADALRAAWEGAGNTGETTVQSVVEFEDNGLQYVITKK